MNILHWLKAHRVAVLKGGWSRERPISLKTGAAVEQAFRRLGVPAVGIDVRRDIASTLLKKKIQFCFIALHGAFGEDGGVQSLLELLKIRYTGSGPLASGLAMDKNLSKKLFVEAGVPTPEWVALSSAQARGASDLKLPRPPWFIKPFDQGSAIGVSRVDRRAHLPAALKACFKLSPTAIVERFVPGRELTVGILGRHALPVVEIIPKHAFYDFHSKYAPGGSRHIVPADLPLSIMRLAQRVALQAFDALTCSVYGRVDLLLEKNGDVTVLEVNTIPGMTSTSLLPDAARAAGIDFDGLVARICELSLEA